MKTKLLIPGILILGLATAPMAAMATPFDTNAIETSITQQQQKQDKDKDKVRIEQDRLPQAVRDAIRMDDKVGKAEIREVWQMTGEDGKVYYAIKFNHEGEERSKKYDASGKEKKDKND
jgi:hypothetical protein